MRWPRRRHAGAPGALVVLAGACAAGALPFAGALPSAGALPFAGDIQLTRVAALPARCRS